jgi:hypothetical protein
MVLEGNPVEVLALFGKQSARHMGGTGQDRCLPLMFSEVVGQRPLQVVVVIIKSLQGLGSNPTLNTMFKVLAT